MLVSLKLVYSQVCAAIKQVNMAFQQHKLQLFHQVLPVTVTVILALACCEGLSPKTHVYWCCP